MTMVPPEQSTKVASPTIAAMPTNNSPITTVPSVTKQTTQLETPSFDIDPAEILALELQAAHQKTPEDPIWLDYLQQQPWTKGRSISFSRSSSEGEEKFYLLMTELPKE